MAEDNNLEIKNIFDRNQTIIFFILQKQTQGFGRIKQQIQKLSKSFSKDHEPINMRQLIF